MNAPSSAPMTIHDWFDGPYPARVRIAIAEKNLQSQIRFESVNLWTGEHKEPAFLAKNYSGTLPVLELADGTLISECTAITEYLDNLAGPPTLTGITPLEKGTIHMMSRRAELELLDAISFYFHHATPGLGPKVELYQNADWGLRQRDRALRAMGYFDGLLKTRPYIAGAAFSMADITVIGAFIFAAIVKLEVPAQYTSLHAWHRRMLERPSVRAWKAMVKTSKAGA
jgi:glutathione S-transferase